MMLPAPLKTGDEIRIISPSSEIQSFPRRLKRGLEALMAAGYRPSLGKNATNKQGHEAGSPEERAEDLNNAFLDQNVKAIIASTGGYTSNRVLEFLDFNLIRENPKIVIGFSDITALLLAVYAKTGLITFHGPNLLSSFGDLAGIHKDSLEAMQRVIAQTDRNGNHKIACSDFEVYSEESLMWDQEDIIERKYSKSDGLKTLASGKAQGVLLGGNLETIISILNTPYAPDFTNCILFLEECNSTTAKTLRDLKTMEHLGILSMVNGIVFGRQFNYRDNSPPYDLKSELTQIGLKYHYPVLYDMPIGHTEPKYTLPVGVNAVLDADHKSLILEQAVQ